MLLEKLFFYKTMCGLRFLKHKFVNMAPVKYRAKEKFSLNEKKELAELVEKYKEKYDKEVETLRGQTTYDYHTKKHIPKKPKQGFLESFTATLLMLNIMTLTC